MQMSDVIADMLTRIRNASDAKHATVDIPASNMKKSIADILVAEGYVKGYQVIEDGKQGMIRVTLKYAAGKQRSSAVCAVYPSPVCVSTPATRICLRL